MGAFEDFVNNNLGVRMPLFIDATTPESSLIAAGSIGSKFVDSSTSFLYEKTGYTNADWVKIAELGEARGGSGIKFSNLTGGLNIDITGWFFEDGSSGVNIHTPCIISGCVSIFDYSGIIGTGDDIPFGVTESGQVGINLYTGDEDMTGLRSPYHFHVSGSSYFSGKKDFYCNEVPAVSVQGNTVLSGALDVDDCTLFASGQRVGINFCAPQYSLHTSGDVTHSGGTLVVEDSGVPLLHATLTGHPYRELGIPFIGLGCNPDSFEVAQPFVVNVSGGMRMHGALLLEGGYAAGGGLPPHATAIEASGGLWSESYVRGDPIVAHGQGTTACSGYWFTYTTSAARDAMGDTDYNKIIFNHTDRQLQVYDRLGDIWNTLVTGQTGVLGVALTDGLAIRGATAGIGLSCVPPVKADAYIEADGGVRVGGSGYMMYGISTTQRDALGQPAFNKIIYNHTVDELQFYKIDSENWVKIETGVASS